MKHVKLLDCTLRDGGYLLESMFGDEVIKGIVNKLTDAGVDIVECGYLKDEAHRKDSVVFSDVDEVKEYLPKNRNGVTSYVLLADYSRYKASDLKPCDGTSIDGIRECFQKHERKDAMNISKIMKEKGYKVYIQPVDILGYTDYELLDLILDVNELKPYAFSIVDTFGSMYQDDLLRLYSLINHNLEDNILIGFHSHNNKQLSFALAQEFIKMSFGKRNIIVDATICGMGRGAGNTSTELVVDYLNQKLGYCYDLDTLLDIVDIYMPQIESKCEWGYSIPNFIAGLYDAHVHNITYLLDKHNIDTKNMRMIIEKVDPILRKKYDYDNLERVYVEHFSRNVDDSEDLKQLKNILIDESVILIAPGNTINTQKKEVEEYITRKRPKVITVNGIFEPYIGDFAFFSNYRRYEYCKENKGNAFNNIRKIITSNVLQESKNNIFVINYNCLIKQGWVHFDNSTIMLLRLLIKLGVKDIAIAGLDGYQTDFTKNYSDEKLELIRNNKTYSLLNQEIAEMLKDLYEHMPGNTKITFITESRFSEIFE